MPDPLWLGVALCLLVGGVVGSVAPLLPGPLLSVAGVLAYWWHTGYAAPSTAFVAAVLLVGVGTFLVDVVAGALASRAGGASTVSALVAAVVGIVALLVTGPVGLVVGVALAVFVSEVALTRDPAAGLRATVAATVGLLASAFVQVLVTLGILFGFVVALVV